MRALPSLLFAALALTACSCSPSSEPGPGPAPEVGTVPPGFSGSVPSPEAQERFARVLGKEVPVGTAGVTEAGWTFVDFSVVPSKAAPGGKGPVVRVRKGSDFRDVHVPDDAALDALTNAVK